MFGKCIAWLGYAITDGYIRSHPLQGVPYKYFFLNYNERL